MSSFDPSNHVVQEYKWVLIPIYRNWLINLFNNHFYNTYSYATLVWVQMIVHVEPMMDWNLATGYLQHRSSVARYEITGEKWKDW